MIEHVQYFDLVDHFLLVELVDAFHGRILYRFSFSCLVNDRELACVVIMFLIIDRLSMNCNCNGGLQSCKRNSRTISNKERENKALDVR